MVGTGGGGSERKVARFGVSVTVAIARASHFASLGGCFAHFNVMPGLTGYLVLCLRCLGWYLRNAIVLGTWGGTGIGCSFYVTGKCLGARASHLLLFATFFSLFFRKVISLPILFRFSFIGLDACASHFALSGGCFATSMSCPA